MLELFTKTLQELAGPVPMWTVLLLSVASAVVWYVLKKKIDQTASLSIEEFKYQLKVREQAAKVAELCVCSLNPKANSERFNQLAWELSLWLPTEIYCDLARTLCNEPGAKNIKQVLIDVRQHLLGKESGGLKAENILHVSPE